MLNVYTKFDSPTELSLYDKLNNKIDLLSHPTT
jgi:hypothetical protein